MTAKEKRIIQIALCPATQNPPELLPRQMVAAAAHVPFHRHPRLACQRVQGSRESSGMYTF